LSADEVKEHVVNRQEDQCSTPWVTCFSSSKREILQDPFIALLLMYTNLLTYCKTNVFGDVNRASGKSSLTLNVFQLDLILVSPVFPHQFAE
jgi:hypothetical protein